MKEKHGKAARPKFHVLFPIDRVTDARLYADMKKMVSGIFPYFDTQALDAARFFFDTTEPNVEVHTGTINLTTFLQGDDFDADMAQGGLPKVIAEGSHNATMSRFAGRVLKRYGNTEEAHGCFMDEAAKCSPPLPAQELATIWRSTRSFYQRIQQQDGYVPPEVYDSDVSFKPGDFSDVGQATVLSRYFGSELRYSPATHYIHYSEIYSQETEPGAQAVAQELTRRQLEKATGDLLATLKKLKENGAQEILDTTSKSKAESLFNDEQAEAYEAFLSAKAYQAFAIKRRESKNITAVLRKAHPMLEISPRDLDTDCFLLCTWLFVPL
jgi:putative DNA primase/helicase